MQKQDTFDDLLPCKGLKVLDLSGILAGPLTASFFAELGAQVIKIENKLTDGDATRQWKLPSEREDDPYSAYYFSANYGKEVLLRDLTQPDERLEVETLLASSDIVISNFQKKVAEKLGFVPEWIRQKYPDIIFAQLSAYTFNDPRPGYDLVMQGETGWIAMTGTDADHLAKLPVALIDVLAAHQMKEAILLALFKKAKTGQGSTIHVSLYQSAISGLANQATNYLMEKHIPQPLGTLHPNIAPYGDIFYSLDNVPFILAVGSDAQFKKLWFTLNLSTEKYPTFEFNSDRLKYRKPLVYEMQQSFNRSSFAEIETVLKTIGVPFCCIKKLDEVFTDPLAKEMVKQQHIQNKTGQSVSSVAFRLQ